MGIHHPVPAKDALASSAVVGPRPVAAGGASGTDQAAAVATRGPVSDKPAPGPDLGAAGRTMMGMPNVEEIRRATEAARLASGEAAQAPAAVSDGAAASGPDHNVPGRTMMGIATPDGQVPASAAGQTKPQLTDTMVGFEAVDLSPAAREALERGQAAEQTGGRAAAAPSPVDAGGRTMLGVGMAGVQEEPESTQRTRAGSKTEPVPPRRSNAAPLLIGLAVLALLALAAVVSMRGGDKASSVETDVVRDGGTEYMQFTVPGAAPGSKVRFGGQEHTLEAGRTRFQLSADSLTVGKNAVLVEVVAPDGSVHSERITLELQHRVRLDTSPLRSGKRAVDVVVTAVPGSTVTLDGKPLPLDAQGRGVRSDPLDAGEQAAADAIEHVVEYRVQPPTGEALVGELRTRIPVATMRIDRPGQAVVTDRDSIEIAGAVGAGTSVSIDGSELPVTEGRFLHRLLLPEVGVFEPRLMATAEGKAPNLATVRVERVADLTAAAAGFEADASLTYAKLVQNPSIYSGQKAAFEGRVYNVSVEGGQSVLQVLARVCPDGTRCPLWITYPAATEYTVDSWVRALGVVAGEQRFRAENDEIRSVPKLEATFLLPAEP